MIKDDDNKKPTYKELAIYLKVSEQAVKQYNPIKRELMLYGLKYKKNYIKWLDDDNQDKPTEVTINGKTKI